jgi:hypothetical protein
MVSSVASSWPNISARSSENSAEHIIIEANITSLKETKKLKLKKSIDKSVLFSADVWAFYMNNHLITSFLAIYRRPIFPAAQIYVRRLLSFAAENFGLLATLLASREKVNENGLAHVQITY